MSENELIQELANLKLKDDGTTLINCEVFSKEKLAQLRNKLQDPKSSNNDIQVLSHQLIDNPTQVLLFLKILDDQSGTILARLIKCTQDSYDSLVLDVLSAIRGILITSSNVREYYLKVYISLITQFRVTNIQHLNLFLTFVCENKDINNAVLVILAHDLELNKKESTETVHEYLQLHMDEQSLDGLELKNFLLTLEMCFPLLPKMCSAMYCSSETKNHILDSFSNHENNPVTTIPILKCVAASSILETCRDFTIKEYYSYLADSLKSQHVRIRILAALSVVKLWTFIQAQQKSAIHVTDLAKDLLLYTTKGDDPEYIEYSLEGLVYLSLFWKVRDQIRMNISFIEKLLQILQTYSTEKRINTSVQYGVLSILSNTTKLKQPEFDTTKKKLKNVSAPQMESESNEESQDNIKLFNKQLVEQYQIISKLSAIKTYQSSSGNNFNEIISIIYHLSTDQSKGMRVELVKQGALVLVMNFLVNTSKIEKSTSIVVARPTQKNEMIPEQRFKALRSLARLLICVDPQISFQKYDVKSAIPFLVELLGPVTSDSANPKQSYLHEMTSLDRYESLLALTNIAAAENPDTRKLLVSQIIPHIDDLIVLQSYIQISSFELLNNLISEPILLAKFFNIELAANKQRLDIVVKLLNSDELKLQVVIAGFLVNATNFDIIADVLVDSKAIFNELMETITGILLEQVKDSDLVDPVSFLLVNLVYALANKDETQLKSLKSDKLKSACMNVLKNGSSESKESISSVWSLLET